MRKEINKRLILIPVNAGEKPIHLVTTAAKLSKYLGKEETYIMRKIMQDRPILFKGEYYYVDYEL